MSVEEEDKEYELKDLIVQTLETSGLLSKIKAQIRANVFKALDDTDKNDPKNDAVPNIAAKRALNAPEGRTAASLVRDFLESANLDYTISVFDPELNSSVGLDKREKISNTLKIRETEQTREFPLLIELLKNFSSSPKETKKDIFSQKVLDSIKAKFDYFDSNKKGSISLEKSAKLFTEIFPNFTASIFEAYIDQESNKNDIRNGLDYKTLLNLVKKWFKQCQITNSDTERVLLETNRSKNTIFDDNQDDDDDLMKLESNFLKQNNKTNNIENKKSSTLGELPPLNQNKKPMNIKDLGRDEDYEDDFTNGTTPRTPSMDRKGLKNRGGLASDEEMEENLSYIEESSKIDEITNDHSISTIHGNNDADYIEDV